MIDKIALHSKTVIEEALCRLGDMYQLLRDTAFEAQHDSVDQSKPTKNWQRLKRAWQVGDVLTDNHCASALKNFQKSIDRSSAKHALLVGSCLFEF